MQRPLPETVTLDDILITKELSQRSPRSPNLLSENQALHTLARQLVNQPKMMLQSLVDIALDLCNAGTAGVSLLEVLPNGEEIFRWNVLAGTLEQYVGGTTPRHFSPCGVCLERGAPVLFSHPERYFTYFQEAKTPVVEGLVLPLVADNHALGTIWIMSHDERRHFDTEDVRVMTSLADFTAAALLLLQRQTGELLAANAALEAEIAERKQAEARLHAIIRNLPGGAVFVVDRDLRYLLAEGEALAAAGFKPEDLVGQTIFEVLPPELATNYEVFYRQALAGEPFEHEHNAHGHSYISRGTPLRSLEGEVYAALVVSYDVSEQQAALRERRRAEEQLRRTDKFNAFRVRLADALRPLTDPVEIQTVAMRVLGECLQVDRVMYGEIDEERDEYFLSDNYVNGVPKLIGRFRISDFGRVSENLRAGKVVSISDMNNDTHMSNLEWESFGALGIVSLIGIPLIKAGRWVSNLGIHHFTTRTWSEDDILFLWETAERTWDAVERARSEQALRESEAKYRSLFESINDGFAIVEMLYNDDNTPFDFRFLEVSPSFEAQSGLAQVTGKTAREVDPSMVAGFIENYNHVAIAGEPVHFEIWHEPFNQWYDVYAFPYGKPEDRQVASVFTNISARKQAQEDRIRLIQEQAAREEERQRAESLAELDRAKTVFFSNVSHEFRTPLTLLLAPLQDALSDGVNPLPPPQRERLELAHCNSLRLLKLVNTMLDFSRIEAGRIEAVYDATDLARLTTDLASVFRSTIERAGLRLIVDCPPLPEPVYVDHQMWEKIVLNLLSNAFKFTFEGEIAVKLHPTDDDRVTLQVQDTGIGIAPEELPHLFERFHQVRGAKARTHEGSGIGLALVYELIRLHGGTVDVSSTVGSGTCFSITIPLGTEHLPSERIQVTRTLTSTALGAAPYVEEAERWLPQQEGETRRGGDKGSEDVFLSPCPRILLVDDNADMRDYLTRILSGHVRVEAVTDGAPALAAVRQTVPDLILSDVMMPEMDGFELLKALRADARTKEVPIILLSARAGEESVVEGLQAGADDYLIKPFSATELVTRVLAHLQMAQLRSQALSQERTMSRMKDKFLAEVSHELNTPLVAILGWTRLLRSSPPSQSMLMKSLETIERNATLQAKLIEDLLDISRITAGKISLNLQPVELLGVIENTVIGLYQTFVNKDIRLECTLDPLPRIVQGDSDRLQQIVSNLLTNAIKFTPSGGRIEIRLEIVEAQAQILVSDTGKGINAEFLPYVFDTFRQSECSQGGLGLGLAIARHLVELHGGTIIAESLGVGQGATFTVKLPLIGVNI